MYGAGELAKKTLSGAACEPYRPSMTERLENERADLAKRLEAIDAALAALKSNPQVQQVLDLVQKVAHF